MDPQKLFEIALGLAALAGTWAVMKYKLDSHSRQIDKLWDWKDSHEKEAGIERLSLHEDIAKLEGGWIATSNSINHFGSQLQSIDGNIKTMQQDLADLKAEKRARNRE